MKKAGLFFLILFLSCNFVWSQDTLYIYKAGIVVVKRAVTDVDSITFSKNTTLPVAETVTDVDGTLYHAVKIGTQTWMVENLKTTKYRNGDAIGTTSYLNMSLTYETAPKYQWAFDGLESNVADFGRLYTWYVVNDSRNIAPVGWHVATDAEWTTLENYLTANGYNYDKTTTGNKISKALCATKFWNYCSTAGTPGNNLSLNNSSGLSLVPAGYRGHDGYFYLIGNGTNVWTATEYSTDNGNHRACGYNVIGLGLGSTNSNKRYGFSVRCVKDVPAVPVLKTISATYVTDSSAVVTGMISSTGGSAITARGICWSTKVNPTIAGSKISITTDSLNLSAQLTGLKADSTYYVRAYATNSLGTGYSDQLSFKTYSKGSTVVIDANGNSYLTVKIGTQTWMAENLKVTHYRNGDAIANVTDNTAWAALTTGAWCYYNNDLTYNAKYGKLYNWAAVNDSRNIAPAGWHVPTDAELTALTDYLGGESVAGGKLKESGTTNWYSPNSGATNESGFSGLAGGLRSYSNGTFRNLNSNGYFWSSTESSSIQAWDRELFYDQSNCFRFNLDSKLYGFSIRCIKDVPAVPVLKTISATYVTDSSAVVTGMISSNGGSAITARGICWSTKANPTIAGSKISITTDSLNLSAQLTGLKADSTYYVRAYATNSLGTGYGDLVSFKTYSKGSTVVIDADGNSYLTVKIGTQTWMAENLKVTHYRNGDAIANVTDINSWINLSSGAYCWYENNITNKEIYGALYNGYTISDSRNIAPKGWHIATDAEWTIMENYLIANGYNFDKTTTENKLSKSLCSTNIWSASSVIGTPGYNPNQNNSTGFSMVPTGYRAWDGYYYIQGTWFGVWTATEYSSSNSIYRYSSYNNIATVSFNTSKTTGLSVRCIKD